MIYTLQDWFIDTAYPNAFIAYSYSPSLVFISFAIACAGATIVLTLLSNAKVGGRGQANPVVKAVCAYALGASVWAMHFIGMLAFSLCTSVSYDPTMTLLSTIPAIIASWGAIEFLDRTHDASNRHFLVSGLVMGLGIGIMHYTGMYAMQMNAYLRFEPYEFGLSVLFAIVFSTASLQVRARLDRYPELKPAAINTISGCILGVAIASMHYMGMRAARFVGYAQTDQPIPPDDHVYLLALVLLGTISTLGFLIAGDFLVRLQSNLRELKQKKRELLQSEKMASLGTLAAGVAHEINNPMGYIRSNLDVLGDYCAKMQPMYDELKALSARSNELPPEVIKEIEGVIKTYEIEFVLDDIKPLLEETRRGGDKVSKIVASLKHFTRKSSEEKRPINISDVIEDAMNLTHNETKYTADIHLAVEDLPLVHANFGELVQVMVNLLINASQALSKHGVIHIKAWHAADKVFITVADNGCGIDEDKINQIFDPFYTTKDVGKGTGLGLSISQGIIIDHGGHISVKSNVNTGTIFTIELPAS